MASSRAIVGAAAIGAAGEYFLDPQNGKRRRHIAFDKARAWIRRPSHKVVAEAERRARYAAGVARGVAHEVTHPHDERDPTLLNDPALAAKVESQVFRSPDLPKGSININVEDRVVFLRGQVPSEEMIDRLVDEVESVERVRGVKSLLHTPDTTAPMKAS